MSVFATPSRFLLLGALAGFAAACGGATAVSDCPTCDVVAAAELQVAVAGPSASEANLNNVLWVQTSVEYATLTTQTFRLAGAQLAIGLADITWTASVEQQDMDFGALPPAVIVDLDETILDNSPYEAWKIVTGQGYSSRTWNQWANLGTARAIPGSLEYLNEAAAAGVTVFYVTNRYAETEEATRRNLEALGAPLHADLDVILSRNEQPDWTSDKGSRREVIGANYRIVQLVGDNFGDFLDGVEGDVGARADLAAQYHDWWGNRWIVLPNSSYGSWDMAIFHGESPQDDAARRTIRLRMMDTWEGPAEQ